MLSAAGVCAQSPAAPSELSTAMPGAVSGVPAATAAVPIAIVPIDASASVTGALEITAGKAMIATSGTISSGAKATDVVLPRRGTLRVCASTTVKLATDTSVPAGETPGLMMALDQGAVEASFATGRNADVLVTPDFRILIGAPGASDVKVRLGQHGDTCVDNPGAHAPYVLVTSVFDGGAYRVQPGQRVMFQHGSLQEVVDDEKEPCGCPAEARPGSNDFPLAESAGLAPVSPPLTAGVSGKAAGSGVSEPLVYQAPGTPEVQAAPAAVPSGSKAAPPKKTGFFHRVGGFFRRIFGAE
jgi:hypothetical protein